MPKDLALGGALTLEAACNAPHSVDAVRECLQHHAEAGSCSEISRSRERAVARRDHAAMIIMGGEVGDMETVGSDI